MFFSVQGAYDGIWDMARCCQWGDGRNMNSMGKYYFEMGLVSRISWMLLLWGLFLAGLAPFCYFLDLLNLMGKRYFFGFPGFLRVCEGFQRLKWVNSDFQESYLFGKEKLAHPSETVFNKGLIWGVFTGLLESVVFHPPLTVILGHVGFSGTQILGFSESTYSSQCVFRHLRSEHGKF